MGVEIVSVRWQARIFCVCGRDSVLERIPAWVVVGRGFSENTGTEPPVSALHNRELESGRSRLLLLRVQRALREDIMASLFFFYLSAIVMSLFISWGEEDKVEVGGGGCPSIRHPTRSLAGASPT